MAGRICPSDWNRVKVSEILGETAVAPVATVDTSLMVISATKYLSQISPNIDRSLRLESGHEDKAGTSP